MAASKTNISKIDKYVKGRLNARDMHQLERETYDDAFLNEALEGYEMLPEDDHDETFADLKKQLHKRAAKAESSVFIKWRILPIAASVLVVLGAGYWFVKPKPGKKQYAQVVEKREGENDVIKKDVETLLPENKKITSHQNITALKPQITHKNNEVLRQTQITIDNPPQIVYKQDTVEYVASDYAIRENATVDEMLRKAEGFEADPNGNITFNGKNVTKVRLNGKDYSGGDVQAATKNLPADILEKIQVIDDYGDQASRTGIRTSEPEKTLNLATLDTKNRRQPTFIEMAGLRVPGDTLARPLPITGWRNFAHYVRENAISSDGKTGEVGLVFDVMPNGEISSIRVTSGFGISYSRNTGSLIMNQKAISIVQNGPAWRGGPAVKEMRLLIQFLP